MPGGIVQLIALFVGQMQNDEVIAGYGVSYSARKRPGNDREISGEHGAIRETGYRPIVRVYPQIQAGVRIIHKIVLTFF